MNKVQIETEMIAVDTDQNEAVEVKPSALKTLNEFELMLVGGGSGDVIF
jgi:hypothetical protein